MPTLEQEIQFEQDVTAGIARELDSGEVEYKCSRCDTWVNSFDIDIEEPLTCGKCIRGY